MSNDSSTTPHRHQLYYVETIVYQVDNILFRVPSRYFHEKSEGFSGASQISATTDEGSSDDKPVKLFLPQGATAEDFLQLVRVIYPLTVGLPPPSDLSRTEWISVLKLATAWVFGDIRKLAITKLSNLHGALDSNGESLLWIDLGRRYSVKAWVLEGLKGLAATNSTTLLPLEKLESIGSDTAMRLLYIRNQQLLNKMKNPRLCGKAREEISMPGYSYGSCNTCGCPRVDHPLKAETEATSVEVIFKDELAAVE
ncbi:hypothetical protein Moror_17849 [Moniliophthora roreri MCA 2997]|uniref:BTB domain-containing protein n=1 Tax=Moniliophthora roreri (strain MCA 2997) TaxID=1381753 RepID=V2YZZ9_MONRO|nr:hypothetical protein Moror_17849 [Moniliophthora roreri MCA 2997]